MTTALALPTFGILLSVGCSNGGGAGPAQAGAPGTAGMAGPGGMVGSGGTAGGAGTTPIVGDPCVAANTCAPGTWVQHDLPGLTTDDTVETVLVDPVRPSDFYAFVGFNGGGTIKVYKSTDFGDTWVNRNQTAGITGNPWGASIDPNPNRDPSVPPTMWSPSGYGSVGAWKSTDGGQSWERSIGCDQAFATYNPFGTALTDLYHVKILPDDPPNHVLATYHYGFKDNPDGGLGETWDGGATWVIHPPPAGFGTSHYVIPVSGTTWDVIAQDNAGKNGIWRTTTAGRVGGTAAAKYRDGTISAAAWTQVDVLEHAHGSHGNVVLPNGTIFATGLVTGARSTDGGATWTHFTQGSWAPPHQFEQSTMTNIAVTDTFIYTMGPPLARAPISDPIGADKWNMSYCQTPATMKTGGAPFGMASSFDPVAKKWMIVAGTYHDGLWKYVEP